MFFALSYRAAVLDVLRPRRRARSLRRLLALHHLRVFRVLRQPGVDLRRPALPASSAVSGGRRGGRRLHERRGKRGRREQDADDTAAVAASAGLRRPDRKEPVSAVHRRQESPGGQLLRRPRLWWAGIQKEKLCGRRRRLTSKDQVRNLTKCNWKEYDETYSRFKNQCFRWFTVWFRFMLVSFLKGSK